jgi:hypothetical protein
MERESEEKVPILDLTSIDTYTLLELFIGILSAQAWQNMGLRVKPGTQEAVKDLEKARTAIDCVSFLIDKLEPQIAKEKSDKLRRMLTDLQVNFARLSVN